MMSKHDRISKRAFSIILLTLLYLHSPVHEEVEVNRISSDKGGEQRGQSEFWGGW